LQCGNLYHFSYLREQWLNLNDGGRSGYRDFLGDDWERSLSHFSGRRGYCRKGNFVLLIFLFLHDGSKGKHPHPVSCELVVGTMHPVAEGFPGDIDAYSESD
jgi:hypothetical protein